MEQENRDLKTERERFKAFLMEHGVNSVDAYLSKLGDRSQNGMTVLMRRVGRCPEDQCILTLNEAQAQKLAEWWYTPEHYHSQNWSANNKAAMNKWLDYRGLTQKPEAPKNGKQERKPEKKERKGNARKPSETNYPILSPEDLLDGLATSRDRREYQKLFRWLTDDPSAIWAGTESRRQLREAQMQEALRERLMDGHQTKIPVLEDLWVRYQLKLRPLLETECYPAMLECRTAYRGSWAEGVDRLHAALKGQRNEEDQSAQEALLHLVELIVQEEPEPTRAVGAVCCDRELWESPVFWEWLKKQHKKQTVGGCRPVAELLNLLRRQPEESRTADQDAAFLELARAFLGHLVPAPPVLKQAIAALGGLPEHWEPIPAEDFDPDTWGSDFATEVTVELAERLLKTPLERYQLREIQEHLSHAERMVQTGTFRELAREANQVRRGGEVFRLQAEISLLQAVCCRLLSEQEARDGLLEVCDLPELVFFCDEKLSHARICAETDGASVLPRVLEESRICFQWFFGGGGIVAKVVRRSDDQQDREEYQSLEEFCRRKWPEAFRLIPREKTRWNRRQEGVRVKKAATLSQDLDSDVPPGTPQEMEEKENSLIASIVHENVSGNIVMLKFNMICDNQILLNLSENAGFQELCRSGCVTISPYVNQGTAINSPRDYIIRSLLDPRHTWHSTDLFRCLPEGLDKQGLLTPEDLKNTPRGDMLAYLRGEKRMSAFSTAWREELSRLAEQYSRISELFRVSAARPYVQKASPKDVAQFYLPVQRRLSELLQEAERNGEQERKEQLLQLCRIGLDERKDAGVLREECFSGWDRLKNRSLFLGAIERAKAVAASEELRLLKNLECTMNHAYILLGSHDICDRCLLTAAPDQRWLLLLRDRQSTSAGSACYARTREKTPDRARYTLKDPDEIKNAYAKVSQANQRIQERQEWDTSLRAQLEREREARRLSEEESCTYMYAAGGLSVSSFTVETNRETVIREEYGAASASGTDYVEENIGGR